ncbi:MAG: T9SS type A sorting domain-containing protein, partial [Bacteroidales bacterium]|nr:T9SS type A sorting domain-containing protein [Bacteroidales bacterium]
GRTYAAWVKFAQPFPVVFSYTDDGGQSWSSPVSINSPANRSAGGDVAIGAGGEVYVCWAGVTETSPFKEIQVGFAKSADGGGQWSVYENAFAVNGITGVLPEKGNIRVNGLPAIDTDTTSGPYHGNIYIVTGQKNLAPSGNDPDIVLYRSTDDGESWSQGIRVNQDAINNGKIQYFPSIHVDRYGAINILFYDDRNTSSDSTGVYLARSTDAGESWTEFEISDHHFKPEPIGGLGQGYQGDNIDLTSTPSTLWPVWMDNSSGLYQIWTAPVDFSAIGQIEEQNNDLGNRISIAPNPVVNSLRIRLKYIQNETVSVNFYNLNGKRLYSGEFIASSEIHQTHQMDLPDLMPFKSVFLVEIKSEKVKKVQRVIRAR